MNAPPLITVPAVAVVMLPTWQTAQPMLLNIGLAAGHRRGDRTARRRLQARMNNVNRVDVVRVILAGAAGSALPSNGPPWTTVPFEVFSVGNSRLVMPISLT